MRLDKLLVELKYGSRKEIKQFAKQGELLVDRKVCKDTSIHVDPSMQQIVFKDEIISYKKHWYVMLYKPKGVISASEDPAHTTVCDLMFPTIRQKLFPVGRLDKDTTGLLLLSNDGDFSHRVAHAKQGIAKTYQTTIEHPLSSEDIQRLSQGIVLDAVQCLPAQIEVIDSHCVLITIQEGKYHQVKRMLEAVDNKVVELKRIKIGNLYLDEQLNEGEFRELTDNDFKLLEVTPC